MNRSKAVDFQVPVQQCGHVPTTLLDAANQPAWAAASGILIGYQGIDTPRKIAGVHARSARGPGVYWHHVIVRVRPRLARRRSTSDRSLNGLSLFDTKAAHVETQRLMGDMWFQAAAQLLTARGESLGRLNDVDFGDAHDYISTFPECAAQIFHMLPDLDVIIGFTMSEVTNDYACVAMMPLGRVAALTEEAFIRYSDSVIAVRVKTDDGQYDDVVLPGKRKWPLQRFGEHDVGVQKHSNGAA